MSAQLEAMELRSSPHLPEKAGVETIMFNVVLALIPIVCFGIFLFGVSVIALVATTTICCVLAEYLVCRCANRASTIPDFSVVITGILLALTLPPGFPLWMAAVGSLVAVFVGKAMFGGLGYNVFNPALVGRAFLQAAFPSAITTWTPAMSADRFTAFIPSTLTLPFTRVQPMDEWLRTASIDGFSGATALALQKFDGISTNAGQLAMGFTAGSSGETSAVLILICGGYLAFRRMMDWRVPASMLLAAFLTSAVFYMIDSTQYPTPVFTLLAGGLMLGAVFMASDMVASPVTPLGVWIYGGLMGFLTVIIRLKGGLPEGVMYAILLGNAVSPIIDNLTQPRIYGAKSRRDTP
ncbi:MAG TPA: RnfABCDGE type electron transport complex subunit D [Candidatus Hydrogenedentes bacterium]|nr:RnfABCDGE type electron transport complex subunit D [Candidatus Hydrogenedentota bacterium]